MSKPNSTPPAAKKTYASPRLVKYGAVHTLTKAGSAGGIETGMGMMGPAMSSCRSVKGNIARVGTHSLGIGLYLFDYKPEFRDRYGHGRQFGVMADEVAQAMPEAVSMGPHDHPVVDYGMLGIRRYRP